MNIIISIVAVVILILLLNVIDDMSEKRKRNSLSWVLISLLITPIVSILLLLLLGETYEARKERIQEEERWKEDIRNKNRNFRKSVQELQSKINETVDQVLKTNEEDFKLKIFVKLADLEILIKKFLNQ